MPYDTCLLALHLRPVGPPLWPPSQAQASNRCQKCITHHLVGLVNYSDCGRLQGQLGVVQEKEKKGVSECVGVNGGRGESRCVTG